MIRLSSILTLILLCMSVTIAHAQSEERSVEEIAKLIDQAEIGSTVLVPAGTYYGNLQITKPIVIDGLGKVVIDGRNEGTVVELRVKDITLRGFTIRGSGSTVDHEPAGVRVFDGPVIIEENRFEDVYFGIDLRQSPDSVIRKNSIVGKDLALGRRGDGIRLWWSHGCTIRENTVRNVRDMVFWYSEELTIAQNYVTMSRYGLHFMYSHHTVMSENELVENSVGIYLMYSNNIKLQRNRIINNRGSSGYGIGLKDCDDIVVENNALLANRVGMYVDNSPSSVDSIGLIAHNSFSYNEIGFLATPITHDNVITENVFIENEEQVTVHGGGQLDLNRFEIDGRGNFWSDYAGFDLEDDGIGDLPYAPRSLFRNLLSREPNLRIFVHSPAQQAIELTSRVFPDLSPKPIFQDSSPLSSIPELKLMTSTDSVTRWPMTVFSLALLLVSVVGGWCIARQSESLSRDTKQVPQSTPGRAHA